MKSLLPFFLFTSLAFAQSLSLLEKREKCYSLLVTEFQNALMKDNGLIQAQLTLTGIKLAKRVAQAQKNQNAINNLNKYASHLVDEKFITKLEKDSDSLRRIGSLYKDYRSKNTVVLMPKLEVFQSLGEMLKSDYVNDKDAGVLMASLAAVEGDESEFDDNDFAISWFINQAGQNFSQEDTHYLYDIVAAALENPKFEDELLREKFFAKNLANARLKIKAALAKVKERVFEANKRYCLSDYEDTWNGQNRSVFVGCSVKEEEIVNSSFLDGIQNILQSGDLAGFTTALSLVDPSERKLDSSQIRAVQDYLNSDKFTDKERVVEYYKRGIYPDRDKCQTFTVVDKKNQTTSVYTVDGEEIFTTNSIQALPRTGNEQVVFNPDSELRRFENGSYTRATSAGVFYSILDMDPAERKRRKYDEEFDDRVFVISPRKYENGDYSYDDHTTIALHGVPINGWVKNATERLASFDGDDRNLSTGCVNMEAYAFDLMNELSQNHCPLYILPEDESNYFHIKNRELSFSTSNPERKSGQEKAKKCVGGKVVLKDKKAHCEGGEWVEDANNVNDYYYSPLSREAYHEGVAVEGDSGVVDTLWKDRKRLIGKVVANNIDAEDFEDLVSLAHATAAGADSAEATFKDLYNSYYALREYKQINFDFMSVDEKRKTILDYYLDPQGFEKFRKSSGRSVYGSIDRSVSALELLEKSKEVRFTHDR